MLIKTPTKVARSKAITLKADGSQSMPIAPRLGAAALAGAFFAACVLLSPPVVAADIAAGEKIATERCAACHGKDGNTPIDPSYAKLAGQHRDYLVHALKEYRSERRKNAIMGAQSKTLSTNDIQNLAAYYSTLPGSLSVMK